MIKITIGKLFDGDKGTLEEWISGLERFQKSIKRTTTQEISTRFSVNTNFNSWWPANVFCEDFYD